MYDGPFIKHWTRGLYRGVLGVPAVACYWRERREKERKRERERKKLIFLCFSFCPRGPPTY